jgi:transcriptional antiterminator RfaH
MNGVSEPFWAVAQTQAGREAFALDQLGRAGFHGYLPRIKVRERSRGVRIVALFPSYLFVHVVDRWQGITRTIGVSRLLLNGEQPARLPAGALAEIKAREDRRGFVKLPTANLSPGQKVKILSGSFEGHIAVYEGMSGRDRDRVLVQFLGRIVRAEVRAGDLAPLELAGRVSLVY